MSEIAVNNNTQNIVNRDLDGIYFRVLRDYGFDSVCFSDLTENERENILKDRNKEWLIQVCCILADRLRAIGDEFNIKGTLRNFDENEVTS